MGKNKNPNKGKCDGETLEEKKWYGKSWDENPWYWIEKISRAKIEWKPQMKNCGESEIKTPKIDMVV